MTRTPARDKAKQFSKLLKKEDPDYNYLREVFRHVRKEMDIKVYSKEKPSELPYVPTEEEIDKYYQAVWQSKNMNDVVIVKTFLYTGVRVSEIIKIKLLDVDLDNFQIRITKDKEDKEDKDRLVPFPRVFAELLAIHMEAAKKRKTTYLFESIRKKPYSDRGIRKIIQKYAIEAGINQTISPHKLRHFLFTWMKKKGVGDAILQSYSGHQQRSSLAVYSKLTLRDCQEEYEKQIRDFPI